MDSQLQKLEAGIALLRVIVDAKNDTLVLIRGKVSNQSFIPVIVALIHLYASATAPANSGRYSLECSEKLTRAAPILISYISHS